MNDPGDAAHDPARDGPAPSGAPAGRLSTFVRIDGRIYHAYMPADLDDIAGRLRATSSLTVDQAALSVLPALFALRDVRELSARLDDPGDPLIGVELHRSLMEACRHLAGVRDRAALGALVTLEPGRGGFAAMLRIGAHRRELTVELAAAHAAAVLRAVARAEHDQGLMRHLVVGMRTRPEKAIEIVEQHIAAGRPELEGAAALAPMRVLPMLTCEGSALLQVTAPGLRGAPPLRRWWRLEEARRYACEVAGMAEKARISESTRAWVEQSGMLPIGQGGPFMRLLSEMT
jgi:hypothetical protein